MPPKAKFLKSDVIAAALNIVERDGFDALTARSLGAELGSSARPIFTVFTGMDEVQGEVIKAARSVYNEYVHEGLKEDIAFRGVGKAYIRFAIERPRLFMLLFMREHGKTRDVSTVLGAIDDNADAIYQSIIDGYGVSDDVARRLYTQLWIYSHGIASLIATGVCKFTPDEISDMLTDIFVGLLAKYKKELK